MKKFIANYRKQELAKVELTKVELGLVDDYNKRIDAANNFRKRAAVSYQKQKMKWVQAIY